MNGEQVVLICRREHKIKKDGKIKWNRQEENGLKWCTNHQSQNYQLRTSSRLEIFSQALR